MKDSGNMKIYYLTRDVYEGVIAFSHGFAMKQNVIYVPNRAIIAQNPQDKNDFFYITDKKIIEEIQNIVDKEKLKAINADTDEVYDLLRTGVDKGKIGKEFNKKAKSLFDIVAKEAPFDIVAKKAKSLFDIVAKEAPKGIKGCCD